MCRYTISSVRHRLRPFANRSLSLNSNISVRWEKALTRTTNLPVKLILRESAIKAQHIHQCICSPPTPLLLGALLSSQELATIPGLTPALIKKHLPQSTATDKGHMRRHRSNTASTRNMQHDIIAAHSEVDHMFPQQEHCAMQDVFCFAALANTITGTMYTDITGAFPVHSFKNMQYIFVAYVYDLNAIIVRAMPSRTDASMVTAFKEVITALKSRGYHPTLNVMDNECSAAVEKYIKNEKNKYPPRPAAQPSSQRF